MKNPNVPQLIPLLLPLNHRTLPSLEGAAELILAPTQITAPKFASPVVGPATRTVI